MQSASAIVNFTPEEAADAELTSQPWAYLEQEYKPEEERPANIADLYNMIALAKSNISSKAYVKGGCSYVRIAGSTVIVTLDFYVWLYPLDLDYTLEASIGEISGGSEFSTRKTFDVEFNGTKSVLLPYIFDGYFRAEMPFILDNGTTIFPPEITSTPITVSLDTACNTVLWADGRAKGHKYTSTMTLNKGNFSVTNVKNVITLKYVSGGEQHEIEMHLQIPDCVKTSLEECPDGNTVGHSTCIDRDCGGDGDPEKTYIVYVNGCDGRELSSGWEDNG